MGDKMKKLFLALLVFITVFLIYFFNINKNIYYVSLGDNLSYGINNLEKIEINYNSEINKYYNKKICKYVNYSNLNDYRVMDLINDIKYNKTVNYNNKEYKFQNLLIKSNLLIISIGMNDIKNKENITYDYIDELLSDIEDLLVLIRKYNKDKIYFLSFYNVINNKDLIDYSNQKLNQMCYENKINYVDISKLDVYMINSTNPSNDGYKYISNKLITLLK